MPGSSTRDRGAYNYDSHWVTDAIENGVLGLSHPLAVSVVKFSLVWDVVMGAYLVTRWESVSTSFAVAWVLGLAWVNVAPYLIWYYDERVLPRFFQQLGEVLRDEAARDELARRYEEFFATHRLSVSAFWTVGTISIIYVSREFLRAQGMSGVGEPFLWVTFLYAAYIGTVLSHGFVGPVVTVLLSRDVATEDIEIDPLHPDGLGGLSNVGYCAIRTTLLFSTGSLMLPILFQFGAASGNHLVIGLFTAIYILTIVASFVYPTVTVNRRAQELRDGVLEDLRREYRRVETEMGGPDDGELSELNRRLELQRIQREFDTYDGVSLYPMQMNILTRLAGSVLLPLFFLLLEFYLPNAI